MRYIMKGGVWKNSQDEILKAAIMKYGLNQWSRISSLLPRKSAKQCKQRWYQWLDPSIKKTQWTRDEDEKLLQLARVFPSQWRTVAPFVGRTPAQCYERYEKLLDLAQGKDPNETNNLRNLRPGQIDPNPQTKPARPDPIDMDQDEKQMLAEVRVRLANTKGKKAKRKQRQKYIDEARRLARLQKARQLLMAGVQNITTQQQMKRLRQRRDINYNKQVPFKRTAPQFVYQAQKTETPTSSMFALNLSLQALQGKRRDAQEENARKQDKKRIKKLQQKDPSTLFNQKMFARPPPAPISLSQPQLNDRDLQDLKRMNLTTPLNTLLHQSQTPSAMTPHNRLMFEAKVNYALNSVGPGQLGQQDIDGVQGLMMLKNFKKQQAQRGQRAQGMTPSITSRINTPINTWDFDNNSSKLKGLFSSLAKPQNIIQFQIPEQQEQDQKQEIMDAQQYQKQQAEKQRLLLIQKLQNRSDVLKKNLPRIRNIPHQINLPNDIQNLISKQYISIVYSDAVDYPCQGIQLPNVQINYKQIIEQQYIQNAKKLIQLQLPSQTPSLHEQIEQIRQHIKFNPKTKKSTYDSKVKTDQTIQYTLDLPLHKQFNKRTEALDKKTNKFLGGFQALIQRNTQELNALLQQYEDTLLKKQSLIELRNQQQQSIVSQLQQLKNYYQMIYKSV